MKICKVQKAESMMGTEVLLFDNEFQETGITKRRIQHIEDGETAASFILLCEKV
jgi:hypothetical protein